MKIMSKKGFITHPATWIIIAFILGFTLAFLIGRGYINFMPGVICPIK